MKREGEGERECENKSIKAEEFMQRMHMHLQTSNGFSPPLIECKYVVCVIK